MSPLSDSVSPLSEGYHFPKAQHGNITVPADTVIFPLRCGKQHDGDAKNHLKRFARTERAKRVKHDDETTRVLLLRLQLESCIILY